MILDGLYKVTHHVVQNLLLTSKQKFHFGLAWHGLAWPGQSGTFFLKSTGGLSQAEWSPCTAELQCYVKLVTGMNH